MSAPITVVIVSYNGRELLARCLDSVLGETAAVRAEVFVVDNASTDGAPDMVEKRFGSVTLIRNRDNLGFAAANNLALRRMSGSVALLLNPDTVLQPGSLQALLGELERDPAVGMVGPRIVNQDGSLQHSVRRFPSVGRQFCEAIGLHRLLRPIGIDCGEVVQGAAVYDSARDVEWISGAVMLVRRQAIADVGLLDEEFFLYSEETDWCRRFADEGWRIRFTPESVVLHTGAVAGANPALFAELVKSKLRYVKKHLTPAAAVAFRTLLIPQYLVRAIVWRVAAVLPRASVAARGRSSMYALGTYSAMLPASRQHNWVTDKRGA
jgi:GT2 family glycosyltransferase